MADLYNTLVELRPEVIDETFKNITQPIEGFVGIKQILPLKEKNSTTYEYITYSSPTGLMSPALPNAPAPVLSFPAVTKTIVEGFPFKEKAVYGSKELAELYTADKDYRAMWLIDEMTVLKTRALARIEWAVWNALRGSVSVSENGVNYSQSYGVTSSVPGVDWSTASNNIYGDIANILTGFNGTGGTPKYMVLNSKTFSYLKNNSAFQNLVTNAGYMKIGDGIREIISDLGLNLIVYDKTYTIGTSTYNFVADNEVFFIAEGSAPLGYFISLVDPNTAKFNVPGKPGFWTKTIEHDDDPYTLEIVGGITGIPIISFPQWVIYVDDVTTP